MALLPLVAAIGTTVAAGIYTAESQKAQGQAEKQIADYRAAIAEQNRIYETRLGERQAGELGLRQAQQKGAIAAAQGASGIDVASGSSAAVRESQYGIAKIEQQDVRDAAARRAYNERVSSQLYTAAGVQAEWAGKTKAMGTYLGTAANVAGKWYAASSQSGGGGGEMSFANPLGSSSQYGFQGWNPYYSG